MVMPKGEYEIFEALNPFFEVVMEGLRGLVDGDYYFDTIAEDAFFEFRYRFPGWPLTIRGRANLMASFSGYGKTIKLHSGDALVVHRSQDSRVVILEYEVHGKILSGGTPYDNRSEEHTSELQSRLHLVCRLLLEKKKNNTTSPLIRQLSA